jgi:branched-chain amino acid transport system permease protein
MKSLHKPLAIFCACAVGAALLPLAFSDDFAISVFCSVAIAILLALSYNMLLGQAGMMSFGHAVYSGMGAYLSIHALNKFADWSVAFPVTLLPLIGGAAGMLVGVLFGYLSTKRSGTPFAMISLGIGELVAASALMLPGFFGGEAGISGNRVTGEGWFGIDFGPQLQMYYLIAAWTLASGLAMYALTCTPLGRIANAVRDNPERVQFIGYDTHRVRFYQLLWSAFFAGIAGSLAALNFELVTAENVSAHASGAILVMTYIGGTGQFFGPVLGAAFVTFLSTVLSNYTKAWPFYYGLLFLLTILFAPGGLSSLIALHAPAWRARLMPLLIPSYALAAATALVLGAAAVLLIEMSYHLSESPDAPAMALFGIGFNAASYAPWLVAAVLLAAGFALLTAARTAVGRAWQRVHEQAQLRGAPQAVLPQPQRQGAAA